MATRMTHPVHGVHFAVGGEVEWNKANGWKVEAKVDPAPVQPPVRADEPVHNVKPPEEDGLASDLRTQYIAKFGKPPHHRQGEASIRAALDE